MNLAIHTYLPADVRERITIRSVMNSATSEPGSTVPKGSSKSLELGAVGGTSYLGRIVQFDSCPSNVRFRFLTPESSHSGIVKSFGRGQAYESRRGIKPRAASVI
jgi:hypothetical protein